MPPKNPISQYPKISRDNNFDVVRLFAALQVCTGHIFTHFNIPGGGISKFLSLFPGVMIFFAVSGFLITSSWCHSKSVKHYFRNRFLRIFPALFVCFIVLQIVLAIFGHINWASFGSFQMWMYWIGQLSLGQFFTPDSLRGFGVGAPNGSLWTIPVEVEFYILVPLLFILMSKLKLWKKLVLLSVGSIAINVVLAKMSVFSDASTNAENLTQGFLNGNFELILRLLNVTILPYLYSFLIGSVIYIYWDNVRNAFTNKALYWLGIYLACRYIFDEGASYQIYSVSDLLCNLLLGCLAISAAFSFGKVYKLLKGIDISYGIYIIHMIVVNIFLELGYGTNLFDGILALIISILLAVVLFKFVEQPALRLKTTGVKDIK